MLKETNRLLMDMSKALTINCTVQSGLTYNLKNKT